MSGREDPPSAAVEMGAGTYRAVFMRKVTHLCPCTLAKQVSPILCSQKADVYLSVYVHPCDSVCLSGCIRIYMHACCACGYGVCALTQVCNE